MTAGEQSQRGAEGLPTDTRRRVSIAIAAAMLASLVAAIFIFAGGEPGPSLEAAEGTVIDADERTIVFRPSEPIDGRSQVEFVVLPQDRDAKLATEHLLLHAGTGGPMVIQYERDGETYYARGAYDLPGVR